MSDYDDDDFDSFSYGGDSWDGGGGGENPQCDPRFPLMTEELLIPVAAMATGALTGALAGATARDGKLMSLITTNYRVTPYTLLTLCGGYTSTCRPH